MRDTFTTFTSFLETCQKSGRTEEMFYPVGFLVGELRCQGVCGGVGKRSIEAMHPGSSWLARILHLESRVFGLRAEPGGC